MKFTPEVVAALEVLRTAAENDFERHRIDVLERDLTAPPTVEIVDDKHQSFDGIIYAERQGKHFFANQSIHRAVWQYYNGEIPYDHVIHHVDGNKANNSINNLHCLTSSEHQILHKVTMAETSEKICRYCGENFLSKGTSDFCSERCRQHAAYEDKENWATRVCPVCGAEFSCYKFSKQTFCSNKCGVSARVQKQLAEKERRTITCENCGKEVSAAEAYSSRFCCESCRGFYRQKTQREQRVCLECGKSFSCYKYSKTVFCSRDCANAHNGKKRRGKL